MNPETRLDSAMFQLTPTRTRCHLLIIANGVKEKVASGLLNPFLSHLKTAQDQIDKGGYSIVLEPNSESKRTASWFTKDTVGRFVRFVSTPEVLERVSTIESEIIQIDEAIAIQSNTKLGLTTVDDHQVKPLENNEGGRYVPDADTEKAIVLYKPSAQQIESKETTFQEGNSKVKLLRVLETRKTVLQKEQGMAFARAVAAGFDMDHMDDLISFADCFGASRLREACLNFVELWKRKHETVQWIEGMEMEAAEGISCQPGLQVPWAVGHGDIYMENSVKTKTEASSDRSTEHMADPSGGRRSPVDPQVPLGQNGYFQGQFQHPMYMQWPIHPPHGGPMFPPYPMPGMPYYPGGSQFFQQPYVQMDSSSFSPAERNMHKRHSMDGKNGDVDSESVTRSQDSEQNAQLEMDREESYSHESRKKVSRLGKKRSGMVVIRNINYITSNREHSGDAESQSGSGSEAEEEEVPVSFQKRKHKDSVRSSKEEAKHLQAADISGSYEKEDSSKREDVDNGNWQAFQNFLLSKDEDNTDRDMFPLHNDAQMKRWDAAAEAAADSIVPDRSWGSNSNQITSGHDIFGSNVSFLSNKRQSDESTKAFANNARRDLGYQHDIQFSESEGRSRGFRRMATDDFLMYGQQNQTSVVGSSCDPIAGSETENPGCADKNSRQDPEDESFIVPLRTSSLTQADRDSRTATGMDLEFLSNLKRREDSDKPIGYEPDELSMIPERGTERTDDPAVDYELQIQADISFGAQGSNLLKELKDESKVVDKQEKRAVDKEKKKVTRSAIEKRKAESVRNLKPTKSSPLAEAQARAERLRAFKVDLQKAKKEQEDEQIKRLEALKRERQKRIAAKSSSMQSPSPSQLTKVRQSTKVSPSLLKSSKFSDSEAASPSPIPKIGARSGSVGSISSTKVLKKSIPSVTHVAGNGFTRSASSVREFKKENAVASSDTKATMTRLRRLSEPKSFSSRLSGGKLTPKKRESNGLRRKISPVNRLDRAKPSAAAILKNTRSSAESDGLGNMISPVSKLDRAKPSAAASFKVTSSPSARPSQDKVKSKESTLGISENQVSLSSSVEWKTSDNSMCLNNKNETMIIDKSVLTIEEEVSTSHASKESKELRSGSHDEHALEEKVKMVPDFASIRVPPSNVVVNEIDSKEKQIKQAVDEVSSKFPRVTINEVQYQAPHARKSSLEDPCAGNSEYSKALPLISEASVAGEPVKAHVLESSWSSPSKPIVDGSEKSSGKESKGFKRLLKFGRKSHGSASGEKDSGQQKAEGDSLDDSVPKGESGLEVHSLKNLISQDDTYSEGGTPHKASRSFSLLSPFRSKK